MFEYHLYEYRQRDPRDFQSRHRPKFKYYKRVVGYIELPEKERPGMSNILADFEWRRTHSSPLPNPKAYKILEPFILASGYHPTGKIIYSRKAGCNMCPCSPGYVIEVEEYGAYDKTSFYATHQDIVKKQLEVKQERKRVECENAEIAAAFGVAV